MSTFWNSFSFGFTFGMIQNTPLSFCFSPFFNPINPFIFNFSMPMFFPTAPFYPSIGMSSFTPVFTPIGNTSYMDNSIFNYNLGNTADTFETNNNSTPQNNSSDTDLSENPKDKSVSPVEQKQERTTSNLTKKKTPLKTENKSKTKKVNTGTVLSKGSSASNPENRTITIPATGAGTRPLGGNTQRFDSLIKKYASKYDVDPNLIKAVMRRESSFNPKAQSKYAKGLMQLQDSTARAYGVKNIWDPEQNIEGGTKFLKDLTKKYNGDLNKILSAYNAGEPVVDDVIRGTNRSGRNRSLYHNPLGIPNFKETKTYVAIVKRYYMEYTSK